MLRFVVSYKNSFLWSGTFNRKLTNRFVLGAETVRG